MRGRRRRSLDWDGTYGIQLIVQLTPMGHWLHYSWVDDVPSCLVSRGVNIGVACRSKETVPFCCLTRVALRSIAADAIAT